MRCAGAKNTAQEFFADSLYVLCPRTIFNGREIAAAVNTD
jgi:hypothetical protein